MKKLLFLIVAIFLLSGCGQKQTISVRESEIEIPGIIESKKDSEFVHTLFSMKKTTLSELEDVRTIIKTTPYFSEKQFVLSVDGTTLNISYDTKLRSVYRSPVELEKSLMQTSLTVFSLVPDIQQTNITLKDVYGEFLSLTFDRNTINEYYGAAYFTPENIYDATSNRDRFESYLLKVLDIGSEETEFDIYIEEISKKLSDEVIIDFESIEKYDAFYRENFELQSFNMAEYAKKNKIKLEKYIDSKLGFFVCDIINFIDNQVETHLYVFKNESIIMNGKVKSRNLLISELKGVSQ